MQSVQAIHFLHSLQLLQYVFFVSFIRISFLHIGHNLFSINYIQFKHIKCLQDNSKQPTSSVRHIGQVAISISLIESKSRYISIIL